MDLPPRGRCNGHDSIVGLSHEAGSGMPCFPILTKGNSLQLLSKLNEELTREALDAGCGQPMHSVSMPVFSMSNVRHIAVPSLPSVLLSPGSV